MSGLAAAASEDVSAREPQAVQAYSAATEVSQRQGRYRQARTLFLSGERSLRAQVQTWEQSAQEWAVGWLKVLALADLQADIPYAEFEAELQRLLRVQSDGLLRLEKEAQDTQALAARALALLEQAPGPSVPEFAEYASVLKTLTQRENELRAALSQVRQIPTSRLPRLTRIATDSRQAVLARVRSALLTRARYPLEKTLASVEALLLAGKVVDPLLAQLTQAENDVNRYALNLQVFHLEDGLARSRQLCTSTQATLATLSSPVSYVSEAKKRATQLCAAIEGHASSLLSYGIPKADLVYEYLNVERASLGLLCQGPTPPVACEKLALLAALSRADLQGMTDAKLRFVEYGWSELREAAQRN
jgi:hypothetical protein